MIPIHDYETDEGRGWFNLETAEEFEQGTRWNGSNHISLATGSQWSWETLYKTRLGGWVLEHSSHMEGAATTYRQLDERRAAEWLLVNEHYQDVTGVPPALADAEV